MSKLFASACIEAPAEVVWARRAKLEDIQLTESKSNTPPVCLTLVSVI